jgi:hypothetical protein
MVRIDWDEITEHCKRKIAHFLGTVECSESPRDKCDWYAACDVLKKYPSLVSLSVEMLARENRRQRGADAGQKVPCEYEYFERICWRVLWENFRHMRGDLPRPPYGNVLFE